jgi:ABC-2 type transport system ATP-binding protein
VQTPREQSTRVPNNMSEPSRQQILKIQDLTFAYPGQAPLASNWSATVGSGVTLLHGDTGTGKSTLLRILAGTLAAAWQQTLAGVRLDQDPEAYARNVFHCEPTTDAFDQVDARACTRKLCAADALFDHAQWQMLVEGFSLLPHLDKPMYMLSTGSKRKVWLAAALASGRSLILLDEPTGGLDGPSIRCLWDALTRLAQKARSPGTVANAVVVASAERIERVPIAQSIELPLS